METQPGGDDEDGEGCLELVVYLRISTGQNKEWTWSWHNSTRTMSGVLLSDTYEVVMFLLRMRTIMFGI